MYLQTNINLVRRSFTNKPIPQPAPASVLSPGELRRIVAELLG